ncbi:unnamed protein product [Ectocarpus sp. 6 AP-2014]
MVDIRQDMVKRAVSFLRHPKVKGAPEAKQIAFLKDKQLTAEEIGEALRKAAELVAAEASAKTRAALVSAPTKRFRKGSVRSEAVVSRGMVFISGQTALPSPTAGDDSGEGDVGVAESLSPEQQAARALDKVKELLEEVGSSTSKVVSALVCVRDLGQDMPGVERAWGRWIDKDNPPARTVIQTGAIVGSGVGGAKPRRGGESIDIRVSVSVTAHL